MLFLFFFDTYALRARPEDSRRTQGWPAWPKDNRATARGQQQNKTWTEGRTQRSGARPGSVASYYFPEREPPNGKVFGEKRHNV